MQYTFEFTPIGENQSVVTAIMPDCQYPVFLGFCERNFRDCHFWYRDPSKKRWAWSETEAGHELMNLLKKRLRSRELVSA